MSKNAATNVFPTVFLAALNGHAPHLGGDVMSAGLLLILIQVRDRSVVESFAEAEISQLDMTVLVQKHAKHTKRSEVHKSAVSATAQSTRQEDGLLVRL